MEFEYVIVQCGGRGTRLYPLTENKPKALVPVRNRPILFHLFEKYPDKKYIIIGDYQYQVLENYLRNFAKVEYVFLQADRSGNTAGIREALSYIPKDQAFMLIWSDIILGDKFDPSQLENGCYIGTTKEFACSWSYKRGRLEKISRKGHGVAGCFLFDTKMRLFDIPWEGSFTRYISMRTDIPFREMAMEGALDIGTVQAVQQIDTKENRCRPYNRITFDGGKVIKEGLTEEGRVLIERENGWYQEAAEYGFRGIPHIYSWTPLTMSRIKGVNLFQANLDEEQKRQAIDELFSVLSELHNLRNVTANAFDMEKDYYLKTIQRLESIRMVIPFSNNEYICINGKKCKNIFFAYEKLLQMTHRLNKDGKFGIIHGDCTFTNTLIDENGDLFLIDARGYFGNTRNYGDVYYDWAKVYYSIQGAFDQFNVGNFRLHVKEDGVEYQIAESGWEHWTDYFLNKIENLDFFRLHLIHCIVWLSLASHCWEDYDSLCVAFYKGVYLFQELAEGRYDARTV